MKKIIIWILSLFLLTGCVSKQSIQQNSFETITMEQAKQKFEEERDYILVDVRGEQEFKEGIFLVLSVCRLRL